MGLMPRVPVVVVGASAGGIEALQAFVGGLPPDFPAAICVVLHLQPHSPSALPRILGQAGPLDAVHPDDGDELRPGRIYVAPPDHHLLVEGDVLGVRQGPKENRFRPSVDALFRSAAYTRASDVVGVVLSGVLDDGTSGLWTIRRLGGIAVVQDPEEAAFDSMPRHALDQVGADHVVRASEMGPLLARLVGTLRLPEEDAGMSQDELEKLGLEVHMASAGPRTLHDVNRLGPYSAFTCPECHGAMVLIEEDDAARFRCHTGHAYTGTTLLSELSEHIEDKLYETLRAMEEAILLMEEMGRRPGRYGTRVEALRERSRQVQQRAEVLQRLTLTHPHPREEDGRNR